MQKVDSNSVLVAALTVALLSLTSVTASAAQAQPPAVKVSQANAETFRALKAAMDAKRYSEVDTKAKAVIANSQSTKDDLYAAHQFLQQSAAARNDIPGQMEALEGQLSSGFLPQGARGAVYRNLIGLAYKVPDYKKAIEYGQQVIKSGEAGPDVYQYVGQAYYEMKDYKAAVNFFSGLVNDKEKAGKKPDRNELILLQSSLAKAGDKAAAEATLQKVVKYYPDPGTWALLIHNVKGARMDFGQKLHFYRLMQATGNLKQYQDFMAYSDAAMATSLYAESQGVLDAGLKANVFPAGADRDRAMRYQKSAVTKAAERKAELARLEAQAKAAATGDDYITLGLAYYSFGQYNEAANAMKAGIAKGKLKNAADAQMSLGVALLKAGQKGEALKAFRAAKSSDEVTQRMAELWALYCS